MTQHINDLIDEVNTARRTSGLWDSKELIDKLQVAWDLINNLPPGTEQQNFKRRQLYQTGLILREIGEFGLAATAHREAAAIAPTEAKRLIELTVAAVEDLHLAIERNDKELFTGAMAALATAEKALRQVQDDDEATKWLTADIPAHRYSSFWLFFDKLDYPQRSDDLLSLRTLPRELLKQYAPWLELFGGIEILRHEKGNDLSIALMTADPPVKGAQHATYVCMGLLIQAKALLRMGLPGLCAQMLHRLVDYPAHGGHFVRAVARRLLKEMTA